MTLSLMGGQSARSHAEATGGGLPRTARAPKKRTRASKTTDPCWTGSYCRGFGAKKVSDVQSRDIHALHVAMKDTPYQANRVLALMSKMFSLAVNWGWRSGNPVKGTERFHEERRERWLSDDELGRIAGALAAHTNERAANAVRFQLLTGARIGEVLSARWSDIDLTRGVWTKPSHHTKQNRTEHLPLSAPALALLAEMRKRAGTAQQFLFPGTRATNRCGHQEVLAKYNRTNGPRDYRLHDNRHTHASHLVSSGLSLEMWAGFSGIQTR